MRAKPVSDNLVSISVSENLVSEKKVTVLVSENLVSNFVSENSVSKNIRSFGKFGLGKKSLVIGITKFGIGKKVTKKQWPKVAKSCL